MAAATAAVGATIGAVATGAFAMVLPTAASNATASTADAAESVGSATLAADTTALRTRSGANAVSAGYLTPIAFLTDGVGTDPSGDDDAALASLNKAGTLADRLTELHAKAEHGRAERARLDSVIAHGGLNGWIAEALRVMGLPQSLAPGVKRIILAESNGNPNAINRWDANADRGTPSQGLMQTIPSTFRYYVHPSLAGRSITDPVANITAGVRYMIANYGIGTVAAGGRYTNGGYMGY